MQDVKVAKLCGVAELSQTHVLPWGSACSAFSGSNQDQVMRKFLLLDLKNLLPTIPTLDHCSYYISVHCWVLWDNFYCIKTFPNRNMSFSFALEISFLRILANEFTMKSRGLKRLFCPSQACLRGSNGGFKIPKMKVSVPLSKFNESETSGLVVSLLWSAHVQISSCITIQLRGLGQSGMNFG